MCVNVHLRKTNLGHHVGNMHVDSGYISRNDVSEIKQRVWTHAHYYVSRQESKMRLGVYLCLTIIP